VKDFANGTAIHYYKHAINMANEIKMLYTILIIYFDYDLIEIHFNTLLFKALTVLNVAKNAFYYVKASPPASDLGLLSVNF